MGNSICCCCCPDDDEYFHHQRRGHRTVHPGGGGGGVPRQFRTQIPVYESSHNQRNTPPNQCRVCGKIMDTSLLDGHEESCRAQARRRMRTASDHGGSSATTAGIHPNHQNNNSRPGSSETTPLNPTNNAAHHQTLPRDEREEDPDHQCVVCLDNRRVVALLPCSHLCVCVECSKMIDSCPLCRGAKESLLIINETAGKCRVCKQYIVPTFLESHQEVCRMRMKELRKKLIKENEQSDANMMKRMKSKENITNNNFASSSSFSPNGTNGEDNNGKKNNDDDEANDELNGGGKEIIIENPSNHFTPPSDDSSLREKKEDDDYNQNHEHEIKDGMCLNCLKNPRERFALPCGHGFCNQCLEGKNNNSSDDNDKNTTASQHELHQQKRQGKLTQCPVCLRQIATSITVFD